MSKTKKTKSKKKPGTKTAAIKAKAESTTSDVGTKKAEAKKASGEKKPRRVSALDAAAEVLSKSADPMRCVNMIKAMGDRGLWTSPNGKTPHATLYAAILREISTKGKDARFTKVDRGQFIANG